MRETLTVETNETFLRGNVTMPFGSIFNFTVAYPSDIRMNAQVEKPNAFTGTSGYSPPAMENLYHSQDLEATFALLSKSITNNIRQTSDNHTVIHGKEGRYVVLIRIRAWFLILPVLLIFGGAIFLAIVVYYTRKAEIEFWGTSTLPIVNLGGRMGSSVFDDKDLKISTMEQKAKQHLIHFSMFQPPRDDLDGADTISQSNTNHETITPDRDPDRVDDTISPNGDGENHETTSPSPRTSADIATINIASPSRTSLIVPSPPPDVLSAGIASNDAWGQTYRDRNIWLGWDGIVASFFFFFFGFWILDFGWCQ